jgi:steroid delta-isomerase-like uncharacterized protein
MDTKQQTNIVRRLYDEVYTKGNVNVSDELLTDNVKVTDPSTKGTKQGISTFKDLESNYLTAFPHKKAKIEEIATIDDKVIVRWSCQGKHEGQFLDASPTHRTFNITGISLYKFSNGKISEIWQSWDRLTLLEQLGIIQTAHTSY